MKYIDILGNNHYALSMIFETAKCLYGECFITIYTNRPDSENTTATVDYVVNDVLHEVLDISAYQDKGNDTVIAGMSPKSRKAIYEVFKKLMPPSLMVPHIHPSSQVASSAKLQQAVRIEPGVVIAPYAKMGFGSMVNRNASIGHHTHIGEYVNINPGAIINGNCNIGDSVTIGAGAIVNDGVIIGAGTTIGSGSVVTKEIPAGVLALGIPAKVIKVF